MALFFHLYFFSEKNQVFGLIQQSGYPTELKTIIQGFENIQPMIEFLAKFYQCYFSIFQCFVEYYKTPHSIFIDLTQFIEPKIILLIQHLAVIGNQNFI